MGLGAQGCAFICQDRRHRSASRDDEPASRALTMLPGRLTTPHGPVTEAVLSFKEPFLCFSTETAAVTAAVAGGGFQH